ncbi:MAG: hypothetical protein LBC39_02410 [Methanobrevibacter sp.]|jgi:hypothetical protein|nr:hypothetical protein [Candidatus Methanovirga aequatorialis]
MKKNLSLIIISLMIASSISSITAQTSNFGDDKLNWLPIHFTDKQGGAWITDIYTEVTVDGVTKKLTYRSSARSDYYRYDYFDNPANFATIEDRMDYNDKIEAKFCVERHSFHDTSWTPVVTFNKGDRLEIITDTNWKSTWVDIYRNGVKEAHAES